MKNKRDELLREVLEKISKYEITAYEIEQNTSLTAVGVQKIINGQTKRPLENTLLTIISYIKQVYEKEDPPRQIQPYDEVDTVDFIDIPDDESDSEELENSFGNKFVKLPNGQYLMYMPLFEWDVAASLLDNNGDTRHPDYDGVEQHVTIVDNPLKGKYSAFRVKGNSMEGIEPGRFIPDGSIVWGRELQQIHWRDHLRISKHKLWIVGSTEFGRPTLKEITEHRVDTATIVVDSWNPSAEFAHNVPISLNTVRMLYYVMKIESSAV